MLQNQSSTNLINNHLPTDSIDDFLIYFSDFKNNPHSPPNASLLFSPSVRRQLAPGFEWQSGALPSNPFSLKSAVKADFLTLEPIITALKSTANSSTKSEGFSTTITLASSANASTQIFEKLINNLTASIGASTNKSNSDSSNTTYTNTIITANNGNLKINSGNDTTIKGANLLAQNTTINTQNNLIIESLQNSSHSKSRSTSFTAGAGGNGGGVSSISLGYNSNRSKFDRDWVDDQTSVIGTNSVTINTGNNTKLKGAVIANATNANETQNKAEWIDGGNLTMNTGSLTTENIYDSEKQKSSGFGLQLSNISVGKATTTTPSTTTPSDTTAANPVGQTTYYPKGSTTLSLQNQGYTKEQTTKATIGQGNITVGSTQIFNNDASSENYGNLISSTGGSAYTDDTTSGQANLNRDIAKSQVITKDTITGALDINVTIDNRLLSRAGRAEIKKEYDKFGILNGGLSDTFKRQSQSKLGANDGKYANILPGFFLSKSETGKSFYQGSDGLWHESMESEQNPTKDPLVNGDGLVKPAGLFYTDSQGKTQFNQYNSNPAFAGLYQLTPFFPSFTFTHDKSIDNDFIDKSNKVGSIPIYLMLTPPAVVSNIFNPNFYQDAYRNLRTPKK